MVVSEGVTDMDELADAKELLKDIDIIGTVLNNSTEKVRTQEGYYYVPSSDSNPVVRS